MKDFLSDLRNDHHDFSGRAFEVDDLEQPWPLYFAWFNAAAAQAVQEPNAMVLSTVNAEMQPASRVVYLKEILDDKFVFYSNYHSAKAEDMEQNQRVCLLFFWPELSRQIKIYGRVSKVAPELSDAYFASRPLDSQLGAWASQQSQSLQKKEELEEKFKMHKAEFGDKVPRPPHWGGYQVEPHYFEFWQGQPSRLHDRLVFKAEAGGWQRFRLNP